MRFLGGTAMVLVLGAPAFAQQESSKDQMILELQRKLEALESRLGKLEAPDQAVPKAQAGLEARLEETIRQNAAEPVREPMRLNFSAPNNAKVEFSGGFRMIGNFWGGYNNGANEDDSLSFGSSVDLGFDIKVSEKTRAYIELHDGRIWGGGAPGGNVDSENGAENLYLNQAFVAVADIYDTGIDLTFGRQKLEYGRERILGDDEWLLNRRAFDGFVFHNDMGGGSSVDVGLVRLGDGDTATDNEITPGGAAAGFDTTAAEAYYVYYTNKSDDLGALDLYYALIDADAFSNVNGGAGLDTRYSTYGVRWEHSAGIFFWDTEFATQFGRVVGMRTKDYGFDAYALSGRGGAKFDDIEFLDTVYLQYDRATGDDFVDSENNAFVQGFNSQHGWFGIMDFASWSNIVQYVIGATFEVAHGKIDVSHRWLEAENDSGFVFGYNNSGIGGANTGHQIGQEFDVVYSVECAQNQNVDLGAAVFLPDTVYEDSLGDHDKVWFAYLQYRLRF